MFGYYQEQVVVRPTVDCGKTMTKQYFREQTDINQIMRKYEKTGVMTFVTNRMPEFLALDDNFSFQDAMNMVIKANKVFDELPSAIRKRFQNSPHEFLEFMQDPANTQEAIELGLAEAANETVQEPTTEASTVTT